MKPTRVRLKFGSDSFTLTDEFQRKASKGITVYLLISAGLVLFVFVWVSMGLVPSIIFAIIYFILTKLILKLLNKILDKYLPRKND